MNLFENNIMEKPKSKCAEIYRIDSHLEIMCTMCSKSYKQIFKFCNHLTKDHFNIENSDFLKHFWEQTDVKEFEVLPVTSSKFDYNEDCDPNLENSNCSFDMCSHPISIYGLPSEEPEENCTLEKNLAKSSYANKKNLELQNSEQKSKIVENFSELKCGKFFCKICHNKITKYGLKKHDHSRYKYQCNICYKLFVSDLSLSVHSRNYHKKRLSFKCKKENCNKEFENEKDFKDHLKCHNERPCKCPFCPKDFVYTSTLKVHIFKNHKYNTENGESQLNAEENRKKIEKSGPEKVICEVCGKSITRRKLSYHLKIHDDFRYSFQCDICKKKFLSQNALKNHIKNIHTQEFTYKCDRENCEEIFVDEHSLKVHKKRHNELFRCQVCCKIFICEYKRDNHYKMYHSDLRTFKCKTCNEGFYSKLDLNNHIIIHSSKMLLLAGDL